MEINLNCGNQLILNIGSAGCKNNNLNSFIQCNSHTNSDEEMINELFPPIKN